MSYGSIRSCDSYWRVGEEAVLASRRPLGALMVAVIATLAVLVPATSAAPLRADGVVTVTSGADDGSAGTLRYAIEHAQAGDTIRLAQPIVVQLDHTLVIDSRLKGLTIEGPGAIADPQASSAPWSAAVGSTHVSVSADNVRFDGLTFQNVAVDLTGPEVIPEQGAAWSPGPSGVSFDHSHFDGQHGLIQAGDGTRALTVTGCTFSGNQPVAITLHNTTGTTITDTTIAISGHVGIEDEASQNLTVTGSNVTASIPVWSGAASATFRENHFIGDPTGMWLWGEGHNVVSNNTIVSHGPGIMDDVAPSQATVLTDNTIETTDHAGLVASSHIVGGHNTFETGKAAAVETKPGAHVTLTSTRGSSPTSATSPVKIGDRRSCDGRAYSAETCPRGTDLCTNGSVCVDANATCQFGSTCRRPYSECDDAGVCLGRSSICHEGGICTRHDSACDRGSICLGRASSCIGSTCTGSGSTCVGRSDCNGAGDDCGARSICTGRASTCDLLDAHCDTGPPSCTGTAPRSRAGDVPPCNSATAPPLPQGDYVIESGADAGTIVHFGYGQPEALPSGFVRYSPDSGWGIVKLNATGAMGIGVPGLYETIQPIVPYDRLSQKGQLLTGAIASEDAALSALPGSRPAAYDKLATAVEQLKQLLSGALAPNIRAELERALNADEAALDRKAPEAIAKLINWALAEKHAAWNALVPAGLDVQVHVNAAPGTTLTSVPTGIACPPKCDGEFIAGTPVHLIPQSVTGMFPNLDGAGCVGAGGCTITPSGPVTVRLQSVDKPMSTRGDAVFAGGLYLNSGVNLKIDGAGRVTAGLPSDSFTSICAVSDVGSDHCFWRLYSHATLVLEAVPDDGWEFVQWLGCPAESSQPLDGQWQATASGNVCVVSTGAVPGYGGTINVIAVFREKPQPPSSAQAPSATPQPSPITLPAPTGLAATAESASTIKLTWTAAPRATGYNVYRSTDGSSFSEIATPATNSYTDTGLTPERYYYEVAATNGLVTSQASPAVSAATLLPAPAAPSVAVLGASSIELTWTSTAGATGYDLVRSTDGVTFTPLASPAEISYTDSGLTPGAAYEYEVRATNAAASSAYSPAARGITIFPAPLAPTLTVLGPTSVGVAWPSVAGATAYDVARSTDCIAFTPIASTVGTTSYTDTGLAPSTRYCIKIRARDDVATSTYSPAATAITLAAPAATIVLNPTGGPTGTAVIVTGHGFAANNLVVTSFAGAQVSSDMADLGGNLVSTFFVPVTAGHGPQVVEADDGHGDTAFATFTLP